MDVLPGQRLHGQTEFFRDVRLVEHRVGRSLVQVQRQRAIRQLAGCLQWVK